MRWRIRQFNGSRRSRSGKGVGRIKRIDRGAQINIPKSATKKPTHVAPQFLVVGSACRSSAATMRKDPVAVQEISSGICAADDRGSKSLGTPLVYRRRGARSARILTRAHRSRRLKPAGDRRAVEGASGEHVCACRRPFSIAGAFAACGFFGPQEQVRQEPGRTTYRAAGDNSLERPDITPAPEKVPGESR